MSSLLDQFPIEIFHLIFNYLWAHEIVYAFGDMNDYLNNILSNYSSYLINFKSIRKSHFDLVCRSIRPEQVISLVLSDQTETPNQLQLFCSLFSVEQFTRLRALKLIELDDDGESFFSVLYKAPQLVSLQVDVKIDLPFIASGPSLERLIINIPSRMHFDINPSIAMIRYERLRELSLSNCSCVELQRIFRRAVRLTSLKVSFTFINPEELRRFASFHQGQTTKSPLVSLSLSVNGAGHTVMRAHLECFLAPFQRLRRLELITFHGANRQLMDAYEWEMFLAEHLPRLKTFNFKFFAWNTHQSVIDQYRRPFWIDKRWYVACNSLSLFTVPHFTPSSIDDSNTPISPEYTTLPIEQHSVFYDRVTTFSLKRDSGRYKQPYRYNHVEKLILDSPLIPENVLDLSKVQSFRVNTSEWSFCKIAILIKRAMPSVNSLTLNCTYPTMGYQHFPNISLEQVRTLSLPQYGDSEGNDSFKWSRVFPCVERLTASINSKSQIRFLISQFKNMDSGFFCFNSYHMGTGKEIRVTRSWLEKQLFHTRGQMTNNFICRIENRYIFSLRLWIGDDDHLDQELQEASKDHWWRQCFPRILIK